MAAARNSETTEDMGRKLYTKESVSELFSSSLFFKCMCCLEVHPHKTHSCSIESLSSDACINQFVIFSFKT